MHHARFDDLAEQAATIGVEPGELSGVLFDLGVSSPQLDQAERGFSYRLDGPLDMRMDPGRRYHEPPTSSTGGPRSELADLFAANGETRFARRIARAVVAHRPLETTTQLAEVVRNAIPAATRRHGGHPARRAFQAIRIAVNDELDVLADALVAAIDGLAPGGRCVAIVVSLG